MPELSVVVPVFNERDNIPPLLAEIAAALRGRVDYEVDSIPDDAAGADPEQAGSDAELREAIMKLEPKYREPLLMQVLGGFSCEEIAAELGVKPGAVMTQLFRARHKLRKLLSGDVAADNKETAHGMP